MKRILLLVTILSALMSQDLKVRAMYAGDGDLAFDFFGAGVDYKLTEISDMPLFGTANLMFGSKDPVSGSLFEFGGTLRKQVNKNFYLKGGTLVSILSITSDLPFIGEVSASDTKLTLLAGAGFLINKQFSVVFDYGFTGADFYRIQLGFDL